MVKWGMGFWKIERRRRLSIFFGFMIFLGVALLGLGILSTIKITPYAKYTNKKYGFSLKFPAYWKVVHKQPIEGAIVVFIAPKTNALDRLNDNFNVSIKDLPEKMSMESLSKTIVNQVSGTFGEQALISQAIPISLAGREGYRLVFAGDDPKIPDPIQYVIVWTMVDRRVYILTFTGLKSDYPLFEKKVNTMFRSFKLFPPEIK